MHDNRIAWALKLIEAGIPEKIAEAAASESEWIRAIIRIRQEFGVRLADARAVVTLCIGESEVFRRQLRIEGKHPYPSTVKEA